ncbi:hypothetical protein KAR91_76100 [Candidatus Pacearchaeota archaeon]|nr:hypothetical protein [Candidatus Pacearchaeota archaeon]
MLRKLLCFIGYHEWTWTLGVDCEFVSLNGPPPETAYCKHCRVMFGKKK